jgi:hypothetical protein
MPRPKRDRPQPTEKIPTIMAHDDMQISTIPDSGRAQETTKTAGMNHGVWFKGGPDRRKSDHVMDAISALSATT